MTRAPFSAFVVALTALAGLITMAAEPGHPRLVFGVIAGTGVAGLFAAIALAVLKRVKAGAKGEIESGAEAAASMARAFAGLMLARMLAYLALMAVAVSMKVVDPLGVGAGLVAGTLMFLIIEVIYLRKLT